LTASKPVPGGGTVIDGDLDRTFERDGYIGPVRVLEPGECRRVLARLRRSEDRLPLAWRKGWAAVSADFYALATIDPILDVLERLIGPDILLWGASLVARPAGAVHHWHTDIESSAPDARTVSVWIGLVNTDMRTSLKVVRHSHDFGTTVQEIAHTKGRNRERVHDSDVDSWSRELDLKAASCICAPATERRCSSTAVSGTDLGVAVRARVCTAGAVHCRQRSRRKRREPHRPGAGRRIA
jgi:hypothetical protein